MTPHRFSLALVIATIGVALPAAAQEAGESVRISYEAPPGCPDGTAFLSQVTARAPRARWARDPTEARHFSVRIVRTRHGYDGTLQTEATPGAESTRALYDVDCAKLTDALALITALAIDPRAVSVTPTPRPTQPTAPAPIDEGAEPASSSEGWVATGVEGFVLSGPAPMALWGMGAHAELGWDAAGLAPSLRLSAQLAPRRQYVSDSGTAGFGWLAGVVAACPTRWRAGQFALVPCLGLETGVIRATGENVVNSRSETRIWVAPGSTLALGWASSAGFRVEVGGGVWLPLIRDRFLLEPEVIHPVPVLAWQAGLALGAHFF